MITLQQVLSSQSNILYGKKVKLVRHKDSRAEYRHIMKDRDALLHYQQEQPKDVFKDCDYIISFIGLEHKHAVLVGIFEVKGTTYKNGNYYYDLRAAPEFSALNDRLMIDWGDSAISWHQWYDKQAKEVISLLPQGYIGYFPGLLDFVLEYDELKKLINNPDANHEWRHQLSAVYGVYLILDESTGLQYIGSANGENGIWQRWSDYAANGHGGNKELKALHKVDPSHHKHFKFSILQSLPSNISQREIIKIEALYKQKLGSRAHGLNKN